MPPSCVLFDGNWWPVGEDTSGVVVEVICDTALSGPPWQHGVDVSLHPPHGLDPTAASRIAVGHDNIVRVV